MNLTVEEKLVVRIMIGGKEKGLMALATIFKTRGDPVGSDDVMQDLLKKIYTQEELEEYLQ